jgi:hypothetical protein
MLRFILLSFLLCLAASPSLATDTDWIAGCKLTAPGILDTAPVATALQPGQVACYRSDSLFDRSTALNVSQCSSLTISQWNNADEDGTFAIMSTRLYLCANSAFERNSCPVVGLPTIAAGNNRWSEVKPSRFLVIDLWSGWSGVPNFYEVLCK